MTPRNAKNRRHPKAAADRIDDMEWQPIETAPKDGTPIIIARAGWDCYPVAQWMEYPGNPVVNAEGADSWMNGWGHDSAGFTAGIEDYWLGWDGDPMPTHWMPKLA